MNPFARLVPNRRAVSREANLVELGPRDLPRLQAHLRADPARNAWLLSTLEALLNPIAPPRPGPRWFAYAPEGLATRAPPPPLVVALGRNVHLSEGPPGTPEPPEECVRALARLILVERLRPTPPAQGPTSGAIVGPARLVERLLDALWPSLGATPPRPPHPVDGVAACTVLPGAGGLTLVNRGPQLLMTVTRARLAPTARSPELAPSEPLDIHELMLADRAMVREELGRDAFSETALDIREMWLTRLEERRSWLVRDTDRRLLFKADVAAMSQEVAQIAGVWTKPAVRRRGLALRGVGELSHWLLRRVGTVSLAVYADNPGAVRLYERLGFRTEATVRALWLL
jgi:RimJ/RimL family protein N-acetyltransferase